MCLNTARHQQVKNRMKNISQIHEDKLSNLRKKQQMNQSSNEKLIIILRAQFTIFHRINFQMIR